MVGILSPQLAGMVSIIGKFLIGLKSGYLRSCSSSNLMGVRWVKMTDFDLEPGITVADALVRIEQWLTESGLAYGHGMGCAADEAAHLIAHVLADAPTVTAAMLSSRIAPPKLDELLALVKERVSSRRPAAYLTGEAWFAGVRFEIDDRVIVPRSPIAELLAEGFSPWVDPLAVSSVLDLCAGSGCIAMVAAMVFETATVDAAELSSEALEVAAKNRSRLGLDDRVRLIQSDLYAGLGGQKYDLIISNPPYVPTTRNMPAEYGHEPAMALFAGDDGLDLAWPILAGAIDYLNDGGWLVLEVGEAVDALVRQLPDLPAMWMELEGASEGVMMICREQLMTCETQLRELSSARR